MVPGALRSQLRQLGMGGMGGQRVWNGDSWVLAVTWDGKRWRWDREGDQSPGDGNMLLRSRAHRGGNGRGGWFPLYL